LARPRIPRIFVNLFDSWPVYPVYPARIYPVALFPWGGGDRFPTEFDTATPVYPQPFESQKRATQVIDQQSIPAEFGNVRLMIGEAFLNRFIARDEQKPGEVRGRHPGGGRDGSPKSPKPN